MTRERWLKLHRWIGIIIVAQVLLSFGSALIFAVRSVIWHIEQSEKPASLARLDAGFDLTEAIRRSGVTNVRRAELWHAGERPFYEIHGDGLAVLDGISGMKMDFTDPAAAGQMAALQTGLAEDWRGKAEQIAQSNIYYKGDLPAWRFVAAGSRHIYVSLRTGKVTKDADRSARVSAFVFEYLHTMKYTDHKLLNSLIPIPYILGGIFLSCIGIYLFISRIIQSRSS